MFSLTAHQRATASSVLRLNLCVPHRRWNGSGAGPHATRYRCDRPPDPSVQLPVNTPRTSLLRWTLALMRPYAGQVAVLGGLSLAELALRALSPWPLKAVIDFVIGHDPLPAWLQALLVPVSGNPQVQVLA